MSIITPGLLNNGQITTASIADGQVTAPKLSADAVTTTKILNDAVTNAKLANDSITLNSNSVALGSSLTLDTDDVGEGSTNLYYTDGRVQTWFGTVGLSMLSTDVVAEGSSNLYHTDARAISAVEGEATLDLTGTVNIEGSASTKNTTIGDDLVSGLYDVHGFTVRAGDTAWSGVTLEEHEGTNKNGFGAFPNPVFAGQVWGGTPGSESALGSGKRLVGLYGQGSYDNGGTIQFPASAPARLIMFTSEEQTSSARGAYVDIETTPVGSVNRKRFTFDGNTLKLCATGTNQGDGVITTGGDLSLDDDVYVTGLLDVTGNTQIDGTLTVDGSVTLGNANTDTITSTGKLVASNGLTLTSLDTATANYLGVTLGIIDTGGVAYITDGDSGSPCIGVWQGSSWKRISFGADISST